MIPAASLCHVSPGRMRLRIPTMRGDDDYFRAVEQGLSSHCGHVAANTTTGSVLLHNAALTSAELRRVAANEGLFDLVESAATAGERYSGPRLASGLSALRAAFIMLLVALAIVQLYRGRVLTSSLSLLWHALEAARWGRDGQ